IIKQGINNMYNLEYQKTRDTFSAIEQSYPGHPVNFLLKGIMTYYEHYPLLPTSPSRPVFESDLRKCIELSSLDPYSESYEAESLLINLCARGLLLTYYTNNDLTMNVIPLTAGTYKYLKKSFDFVTVFADFYFFTGTYNYYWEAYPRIHPVYKSLASLFPPGDMKTGMNELAQAAQQSIFVKVESYSRLISIYTGFENNYTVASLYSKKLTVQYPGNPLFKSDHIKNLLLLNEFDQAENILTDSVENTGNGLYEAQVLIFNGILQEKKYKNLALAKQFYEDGINAGSPFGDYNKEFCAYGYFGLSRISEYYGDKVGSRVYRRKALDMTDFKEVSFD
ncbi:MAG: hypothetical protein R6W81_01035, partial [Bacteroidales bacterium]